MPNPTVNTSAAQELGHIIRELRAVYGILDNATEKALAEVARTQGHVTSCGSCRTAGCCYQLTTISVPEGLALADALLAMDDDNDVTWHDLVPLLVKTAHEDSKPGLTRASRMRAAVPCPLLDLTPGDDGRPVNRCIAYENRPGCCRFHNAVTSPDLCTPAAVNAEKKIGSIDLVELEGALWEVATAMSRDLGLDAFSHAPISLMLLACLGSLLHARGREDDCEYVEQAARGLPDPLLWMRDHAQDLFAEPTEDLNDVGAAAHGQKLVQIARKVFGDV